MRHTLTLSVALGILFLGGCGKKTDDLKVAQDIAQGSALPSGLQAMKEQKGVSAGKNAGSNAPGYVMQPLEEQMRVYQAEVEKKRALLERSKQRQQEYTMRAESIAENLARTEARLHNLQKVASMLEKEPQKLAQMPRPAGSFGDSSEFAAATGFNSDLQPMRQATGDLAGKNFNTANLSEIKPAEFAVAASPSKSPWSTVSAETKPLKPVPSSPRRRQAGERWEAPLAATEPKILLCEGEGADSRIMLNIGKNDKALPGMLYEATGAGGERNVLIVTEVHGSNSMARLLPQHAGGGLKPGISIKNISAP